jgi:glycosyltransferase involved in cell wall biosynthesis
LTSDRAGAASARNVGIAAARGDWVAFLDDDDEWRHDKWSRQLDLQRRFPNAVAVFSDAWIREADGSRSRTVWTRQPPAAGDVKAPLAADNFIPTSSMAVRRDVLARAGGFRPEFEPAEDYDLWLRISRLGLMAFDP